MGIQIIFVNVVKLEYKIVGFLSSIYLNLNLPRNIWLYFSSHVFDRLKFYLTDLQFDF